MRFNRVMLPVPPLSEPAKRRRRGFITYLLLFEKDTNIIGTRGDERSNKLREQVTSVMLNVL